MRRLTVSTLALVVMACGTAAPPVASQPTPQIITVLITPAPATASPIATPAPGVSALPSLPSLPGPTVGATPTTPAAATASPAGLRTGFFLYTDTDFGRVIGQVILRVENTGNTWIELLGFDSPWTIYDADGAITETGNFSIATPRLLAPGDTGYLLAELFSEGSESDFVELDAEMYFNEARSPEAVLTVDATRVRRAEFGGGIEVVGQVRNDGADRVNTALVAAVFLNNAGEPIGMAWTFADNVESGGTRTFTAQSEFPRSMDEIAQTLYFASDQGF